MGLEDLISLRNIGIIFLTILTILVIWGGIRNRKISILALIVLIVPIGVLGWMEYDWKQQQEVISENAIQPITGTDLSKFKCQRFTAAFVDVWASEYTIDAGEFNVGLKHNMCNEILEYAKSETKTIDNLEQLKAIHIVSTESVKIANPLLTQAQAKCLGIVNIPIVVEGLGGTAYDGQYAHYLFVQELASKDKETRRC